MNNIDIKHLKEMELQYSMSILSSKRAILTESLECLLKDIMRRLTR